MYCVMDMILCSPIIGQFFDSTRSDEHQDVSFLKVQVWLQSF